MLQDFHSPHYIQDVATETADIVLMKNDLRDVVVAIDLSKKTYRRIWLNFLWAFVCNILVPPSLLGIGI